MRKIGLGFLAAFVLSWGVEAQEKKPSLNPAQLLPSDAVAWISIEDFGDGVRQLQNYLQTMTNKKKGDELFDDLKTQIKTGLANAPADAGSAIKAGLKSLKSLHAGIFKSPSGDYDMGLVVEFNDPKVTSDIVALLAAEARDSSKFQERTLSHIVTNERQSSFQNIFVSALDNIAIATTSAQLARSAITRYTVGTSTENSLPLTPEYQKFSSRSQSFSIGAYLDVATVIKEIVKTLGRRERMAFDKIDAMMMLAKIMSFNLRVYFEEGKICSEGSLRFDRDCTLFNDFLKLQPSAAKDTLKMLPSDGLISFVSIINSNTLKKWWQKGKEISESGVFPTSPVGVVPQGAGKKWLDEFEEHLGVKMDKVFDVIDNEGAAYMDVGDLFNMRGGGFPDAVYMYKCRTKDKLLSLLGKLKDGGAVKDAKKEFDKLRMKKYGGDAIYYVRKPQSQGARGMPTTYACSIIDNYFVFGFSINAIEKVIDAYREGESIANSKDYQEAMSKMPEKYNAVCFFNAKRLLQMIEPLAQGAGSNFPNITESMKGGGLDTLVCVSGDNEYFFKTSGVGVFPVFPLVIPTVFAFRAPLVLLGSVNEEEEPQAIEPAEPFTPPQDSTELDKMISQLIKDLGSDDADKRNAATDKLELIGKPVVNAVKGVMNSPDPEVELRARNILLYLKQYELFPDELSRKVKTLWDDINQVSAQQYSPFKTDYWRNPDGADAQLEPGTGYLSFYMPKKLDFSILECDTGIKEFSQHLLTEKNEDIVRYMMNILTRYNASAASEAILKIYSDASNRELKCLSLIALGWSNDPKAKESIVKALESDKAGDRRAAFLAIERSSDTAFIDKLITLLESPDDETRFNAGYTFAKLSIDQVKFNAFASKDILASSVDSARQWWNAHKTTFTINKRTKITKSNSFFPH